MTDVRTLDTVIADWRERVAHSVRGAMIPVGTITELLDDVRTGAEDYLTFLPEKEAVLWSGHSKEWLRLRFAAWERLGNAKRREHGRGERMYRRLVLPRRANIGAARADAIRTARKKSA